MFTFILVAGIIIAFLLILVVLIQNPKGGGIASNFSAGNQIFGVKRTTDFIEKLTWGCAFGILLVSLFASSQNGVKDPKTGTKTSNPDVENAVNATPVPGTKPAQPAGGNGQGNPGNTAPQAMPAQQGPPQGPVAPATPAK